jgi:thiaminase/transcriptional activator TenA
VGGGRRPTDDLRREADGIWRLLRDHPFVVGLFSGELPAAKFRYYLVQDYWYLVDLSRALALLASRLPSPGLVAGALELAREEASVEMESYLRILPEAGVDPGSLGSAERSPTSLAYSNFLLRTCALETPLECASAMLPCFWSYQELARAHEAELRRNPVELYRRWGEAYLGEEYGRVVEGLRGIVDALWAEGLRAAAVRSFILGSRYELMFWDAAYAEEGWPDATSPPQEGGQAPRERERGREDGRHRRSQGEDRGPQPQRARHHPHQGGEERAEEHHRRGEVAVRGAPGPEVESPGERYDAQRVRQAVRHPQDGEGGRVEDDGGRRPGGRQAGERQGGGEQHQGREVPGGPGRERGPRREGGGVEGDVEEDSGRARGPEALHGVERREGGHEGERYLVGQLVQERDREPRAPHDLARGRGAPRRLLREGGERGQGPHQRRHGLEQ